MTWKIKDMLIATYKADSEVPGQDGKLVANLIPLPQQIVFLCQSNFMEIKTLS